MQIIKTKFKNLLIVNKPTHKDSRGYLRELYKKKIINCDFKFSILSKSKKNVLRGLHFQHKKPQAKYITVIKGKLFDVAVDLRKKSKTYGKHFSIILSENENKSLFIPEGFAHGFCSLSNETIMYYMCSNYRDPNSELGIKWNDTDLNIKWPIKNPIISTKDSNNLNFKQFKIINRF